MPPSIEHRIAQQIAEEIGCRPQQVVATVALLGEGATVPFIARYRKEVTGGLDDIQLRLLDERLIYLRELEDRRGAILASIDEQGKLTPELAAEIALAATKQRLEDLYLPYKQKRRTKAQIAREAGIAPLAEALLADPTRSPEDEAAAYLNAEAGFADIKSVLDGARQILMEQFAEDAALLGGLREYLDEHGVVKSTLVAGKETDGAKFRDYFDYWKRSAPSRRTAHWRCCAGVTKACCKSPCCSIQNSTKPIVHPATTPVRAVLPNASASPIRDARPTSGWPIRCAGHGASRSSCTSSWS